MSTARDILHWWYCGECDKYHSGRTIAYDWSDGMCDMVCSVGKAKIIEDTKNDDPKEQIKEEHFTAFLKGEKFRT